MPSALITLADGFETMEAIIPIDILRRCGFELTVAGLNQMSQTSGQKVKVECDALVSNIADKLFDVIILPGGMPNAKLLGEDATIQNILKSHKDAGKWIAAICAAPAQVLGRNGFMSGVKGVCYPAAALEELMGASLITNQSNHTDVENKIITAAGPGNAIMFAMDIAKALHVDYKTVEKNMLLK